ncbi:MAG: branched-chain amino acid ABC transporter substrate-binding protein [Betaproteobacteria bacterium RIFCSPLOWO2_02_FULL_65_20]|nr:MAG: branched-chain amino acid ABC transporter substrate-binding protein [Betaproteobacteria bacterium RIFCSPLOWO2_02_FULL_65_20]
MTRKHPRLAAGLHSAVQLATGLLLAAGLASAHAADPLKIGFGMSMTGPLAGNGKAALLAMEIWRDDVNAKGGLLGRKVEFVTYDDQTNPSTVPGIYNKLLDIDKVDIIMSGYGTNVIAPAIPIAMQRKMVLMSLFGTDVNAKFKYDGYFQIMPNGADPSLGLVNGFFEIAAAMKPKAQTVALVGADAEYPHAALEGARRSVKNHKMKIVYDKTYPPNTTDCAPIIRAIQATNPDVVFVASYPPDSACIVRAANEVGLKTKQFGGPMIGLGYAALKTQLGPLLNGMTSWELYVPEPTIKFPFIKEFLAKYQPRAATEKLDPLGFYLPPYAYAQMQIVGEAIQKVGSLDQGKIAKYIHANKFSTVVGDVSFAKNGEWAVGRPLYVQYRGIVGNDLEQWKQPGKAVVVWPASLKSGEHRYPYDQNRK